MSYRLLNPFSLLFLTTLVLSLGIAVVAYRNRSRRAAVPLAGFMIAVSIWCGADALRIAAPTRSHILFWNKVSYLGIVSVVPTYVTFVLTITNRERWLERRYILGMIGVSVLTYVIVLTNPLHGLWRAGEAISPGAAPPVLDELRGPIWYVWAAYVYTLVPLTLYLLFREFLQRSQSRTYRNQIGLVLAGSLFASLTTALFILGIVPFDPSPIGFAGMGLAYTGALFRYRLLDITPIARDFILDEMDSGVLVLDQDDQVVDANDSAHDISDRDEFVGLNVRELLPPGVTYEEYFGDVEETAETIAVELDDGTRHFDVEISPIYDSLNSYLGRVIIFTDVTELVEKRQRLQERTQRLEHKNARLDEFTSVVSHDLRGPLQVAAGALEIGRRDDDPEKFDRVESALDRMETIIDDLLVLARAGTTLEETDSVDLRAIAAQARHHIPTDGAEIDVGADLPVVEGDQNRLLQLFENCYRNAVDHNDAPVSITVGANGETFFIEDDGRGIPEGQREQIFEHGFSTTSDGTGFGLSIVRDIVDAHGWEITATEGTDGGARFEITTT